MFVGREKELSIINSFLQKPGALLVYGLRRIGKTTLIKKALDDNKSQYVYFECQKANEQVNVNLFIDILKEKIDFIDASFTTFLQVFKELNKRYSNFTFVIDEYSYLKQYYLESKAPETREHAEKIDSEFQDIIDNHLTDINLILSGSIINIMETLVDHKSALYGRFNDIIALKELSYLDAKTMLPNLSNHDIVAFYSVFGGSPYVLERVDSTKSLKENICVLLLNEFGRLRTHLKNNVINELESDPDLHDILSVIKNGAKKYSEIEAQCNIKTSGLLDKRLKKLIDLNIIETKYPIDRENDKRKKYYLIKDNLLKFYYAYVFRQDNKINLLGEDRYYELYIMPSIKTFISLRFENIAKNYFSLAIKKGLYPNIVDIGSYFTNNNEYDCVIKKKDGSYAFFEVKYYTKEVNPGIIHKEIEQIKEIKGLNITEIGFISSSGFISTIDGIKYLDIDDIFFDK